MAVVGGLAQDQGEDRVQLFIQDFILTQLVGKSIDDMWQINNPMGVLTDLLRAENKGEPEPR